MKDVRINYQKQTRIFLSEICKVVAEIHEGMRAKKIFVTR